MCIRLNQLEAAFETNLGCQNWDLTSVQPNSASCSHTAVNIHYKQLNTPDILIYKTVEA